MDTNMMVTLPCSIYCYEISIVDISTLLKNKDNLENIDIDKDYLENIDIDKDILENIDINIDIDRDILGEKIFSRFKTFFVLFSMKN